MKAIRIHQYGSEEELIVEEVPKPECQVDDVLVKVHAAGVNPIDWKVRSGSYASVFDFKFPFILGWDVSGTVESVGSKVEDFKVGDAVYSLVAFPQLGNCYAETVAVKAEHLWHKPTDFSFEQAAATPLVALTAWQVLFDIGKLKASEKVLIHAGAGGVGHVAIQLAKAKGAFVYTTCSKSKIPLVSDLGADVVIDYQQDNFQDLVKDLDLVIDTVGGAITKQSLSVLKDNGTLVTIASMITPEIEALAQTRQLRAVRHLVHPSQAQLQEITQLANEGLLTIHLAEAFHYSKVKNAHQNIESGHTQGKIVLTF